MCGFEQEYDTENIIPAILMSLFLIFKNLKNFPSLILFTNIRLSSVVNILKIGIIH